MIPDYNPIERYEARPKECNYLVIGYLVVGGLQLPLTLMLVISSFKLIFKKFTPNLTIGIWILIIDFINICTIFSIGLLSLIDGYYLPNHQLLCDFNAIIYLGSVYISSWYVALLSLERGLLLIHKVKLNLKFWIVVMVIEFFYFMICNLVTIANGEMELMTLAVYCLGNPDTLFGYFTIISYAVMMWLSTIIVCYSYIGIAITQRLFCYKQIRELSLDKKGAIKENNIIIGKVLIILILYLLTNTFELVNTTMELITGVTRLPICDLISTILIAWNPLLNSMLLLHFQKDIQECFISNFPFMKRLLFNSSLYT
jgi:hypothetical protein